MSFLRYSAHQASGVEWLGSVPKGWRVVAGRRMLTRRKQLNVGLSCEDRLALTMRGVVPRDLDDLDGLQASDFEAYQIVEKDDLLFKLIDLQNIRTSRVGLVPCTGIVSPAYIRLCVTEGRLLPRYAYWYFFRLYALNVFNELGGGVRQTLGAEDLLSLQIVVPAVSEQHAICAFLDRETAKIDALIAEQESLIELLREKRQAVISHAVTKGLRPDVPMKSSGVEWLGEVPQAWTVSKLGRVIFLQEGPGLRNWQFTDEGTRVICVTNITDQGIDFSRLAKFISIDEYRSSYQHFTVHAGDVLLSSSGNSWGKVAVYEGEEAVILNTSTIRLNSGDDTKVIRDYIVLLLQSDAVREQLSLAMTGSCQPNFGPTHLSGVMVAIPSQEEQGAIVECLAADLSILDTLTAETQRSISLLQERRSALISAAVTGQIDVRGFVGQEAA